MNDYLAPTVDLAVPYCPGCDPERGLGTEILEPRWCPAHALSTRGAADADVPHSDHVAGVSEADGHDCRAMAKLLRGEAP